MNKLLIQVSTCCACTVLGTLAEATSDDRGDRWVWIQEAQLAADDGTAGDLLGNSVGIDGVTVVAGAHEDDDLGIQSGAAYVFVRSGTSWTKQAKLHAYDGSSSDKFDRSVAIDGNWILVGAPFDDDAGQESGSAHIFYRSGTGWTEQAKLLAASGTKDDEFGLSVSIDRDTALVGALYAGGSSPDSGAAYVFVRSDWMWMEQARLIAPDGRPDDRFGWSVAIEGDTAVIGAYSHQHGSVRQGAAYVFVRSGGTWAFQAELLPLDETSAFGWSVSIDGDTALIGAFGDSDMGSNSGAAYVFVRSGTSWSQQAKIAGYDADAYDHFGCSVSLDNNTALIGAYQTDSSGSDAGAAYVFKRSGSGWRYQDVFLAEDASSVWNFGNSVSISDDLALIGAPGADLGGQDTGGAYVFTPVPAAWATFRNAGSNPASYVASTLPILGTSYIGDVDLVGTTGHDLAWLVGYSTPITWQLGTGQYLLVNVVDSSGELLKQAPLPGPTASFNIPIPADGFLAGYDLSTQVMHFGGVQLFALSNAQDLTLGY